jgi:hypothetical protein
MDVFQMLSNVSNVFLVYIIIMGVLAAFTIALVFFVVQPEIGLAQIFSGMIGTMLGFLLFPIYLIIFSWGFAKNEEVQAQQSNVGWIKWYFIFQWLFVLPFFLLLIYLIFSLAPFMPKFVQDNFLSYAFSGLIVGCISILVAYRATYHHF